MAFYLISLTLMTYFMSSGQSTFQEVSDTFAANELTLLGLNSLFYILLLLALYPIARVSHQDLFTAYRLEHYFIPGIFEGAIVATLLALSYLVSGFYEYMGFFIQLEETPLALMSILSRSAALVSLALIEEYIFRKTLLHWLSESLPRGAAILIVAVAYVLLKALQIDLGWVQALTLFLLSLNLGLRTLTDHDSLKGAGYWAGVLLAFHVWFSLPVLGSDFQGLVMLRPIPLDPVDQVWIRILSGGAGGPLSSLGFQLILVTDTLRRFFKHQKSLGIFQSRKQNERHEYTRSNITRNA